VRLLKKLMALLRHEAMRKVRPSLKAKQTWSTSQGTSAFDPGCVKTLRGIIAP
jgi:hypothetical protein